MRLGGSTGSLTSLAVVLECLGCDAHNEPISFLRNVPAIRQLVPAHPVFNEAALRFKAPWP